jgi:hypothetical protein
VLRMWDFLCGSQGWAFELDPVSLVDKPIEDGIGDGGIAHSVMPEVDRELAGDQGGPETVPVVEYLKQVPVAAQCLSFPP